MPETKQQNFANHAKFDPKFHFFLAPIFLINAISAIVALFRNPSLSTAWAFIFAAALLVAIFTIRIYSLKVQDRVIRLEERLRLSQLLPDSTRSRIGELSESQLIALRFASDKEVPALVQKILSENWKSADIKKAVTQWRPDYFRV
jgi:hypothetical protein